MIKRAWITLLDVMETYVRFDLERLLAQQVRFLLAVRFDQKFQVRQRFRVLGDDHQQEIRLYMFSIIPPVGPVSP
jgi:hypothetical protein